MKIRKQTYSLDQYLKLMNAETIRTDQECQRLSGQWTPNMVNELIAAVRFLYSATQTPRSPRIWMNTW